MKSTTHTRVTPRGHGYITILSQLNVIEAGPFFGEGAVQKLGNRTVNRQNDNRRRHERTKRPLCAWLEFQDEAGGRGMVTVDLGAEGAQFTSMQPVVPDEPVLVRLQTGPGGKALECKGRVCWIRFMPNRLFNFGVRFVDLTDHERDSLTSIINNKGDLTACPAV
jgi:hypothetical protein